MRLFNKQDEALIAQLRSDLDRMQTQFEKAQASLEAARRETIELMDKLAQAKAAPQQAPTQLTTAMIAARLRIPEHLVDQIDLDRLGMQVPVKMRHQ